MVKNTPASSKSPVLQRTEVKCLLLRERRCSSHGLPGLACVSPRCGYAGTLLNVFTSNCVPSFKKTDGRRSELEMGLTVCLLSILIKLRFLLHKVIACQINKHRHRHTHTHTNTQRYSNSQTNYDILDLTKKTEAPLKPLLNSALLCSLWCSQHVTTC